MQCLFDPAMCLAGGLDAAQAWALGLVPDWLLFLFAVPVPIWWAVSLVLAYVLGKWGWGGVLAVLTIGVSAFVAARMSMSKEPAGEYGELDRDPDPVPQPRPRRTLRDLFRHNR